MGGGYQFHLAYDTSQIEPAVLDDLQNGRILAGHVLNCCKSGKDGLLGSPWPSLPAGLAGRCDSV